MTAQSIEAPIATKKHWGSAAAVIGGLLAAEAFISSLQPAPSVSAVEQLYREQLVGIGQCLDGTAYDPDTKPFPSLQTDHNTPDGHEQLTVTPANAAFLPLHLILSMDPSKEGVDRFIAVPIDDQASQEILAACE